MAPDAFGRFILQSQLLMVIALLQQKRRLQQRKPYKKKRFWVRKIFQGRKKLGQFHTLAAELRIHKREYIFSGW